MTAHSGLLLLEKFLLKSNQILLRASLLLFQQTTLEEAEGKGRFADSCLEPSHQ